MRTNIKNITGLIFLFIITGLTAQEEIDISKLNGRWHLDFQKTFANMDAASFKKLESIPDEAREKVKSNYANRDYTFGDNGMFQIDYNDGIVYDANWQVLNGNKIKIKDGHGSIDFYKVVNLTDAELTMEVEPKGGGTVLVKILYFKKI